ncbi:MAG: polyprenyl synthetase family protein [Epsilonproteobacteria bacterium]|nr:MAG: polyprenyl synthetase family protein [Campylobacterota bacterium]
MPNSSKELLNKFEAYLQNNLPAVQTFHPSFNTALQVMIKAKAKRFRPILMLSIVDNLSPLLLKNSFDIAVALEIFHTYSLIHDDLPSMDDAILRRGIETLHKTYDDATAILVGDALNTHTFHLVANSSLSSLTKIDIIKQLSLDGGINGMVVGQAIDIYFENKTLGLDELKILHLNKTAKLIATSLKIGAIICELGDKTTNKLYDIGMDIGLLFQIQDDILDNTLNDQQALKSTNKDNEKNTFVNLLGLDGAIDEANKLSDKILSQINNLQPNLQVALKGTLKGYLHRHN